MLGMGDLWLFAISEGLSLLLDRFCLQQRVVYWDSHCSFMAFQGLTLHCWFLIFYVLNYSCHFAPLFVRDFLHLFPVRQCWAPRLWLWMHRHQASLCSYKASVAWRVHCLHWSLFIWASPRCSKVVSCPGSSLSAAETVALEFLLLLRGVSCMGPALPPLCSASLGPSLLLHSVARFGLLLLVSGAASPGLLLLLQGVSHLESPLSVVESVHPEPSLFLRGASRLDLSLSACDITNLGSSLLMQHMI